MNPDLNIFYQMKTSFKEIESIYFPSEVKNISLAENLVDNVCKSNNVHEDHYGNILIAVTEAVNNAIQHGNLESVDEVVKISVEMNEQELRFVVLDAGKGFDYKLLPDPTAPENIEKECGRGIFLMKSLADEVSYQNNGSQVTLLFKNLK